MNLEAVFRQFGCDKADHGYHAVYEKLPEPAAMVEVGVYKGASLRAWRKWWPNALLIGVDTFERGDFPLPKSQMPQAMVCKADSRYWTPSYTAELIIDDGSHKPRDQAATLRNLWPLLAPGGVYFIEDVFPVDQWLGIEDKMPQWFRDRREHFDFAAYVDLGKAILERDCKMVRHDFRAKSGKPDSVLLEIRKPCSR